MKRGYMHSNSWRNEIKAFISFAAPFAIAALLFLPQGAYGQELDSGELEAGELQPVSMLQEFRNSWEEMPYSDKFKITLEYRNYSYFSNDDRSGTSDSINEGRLGVEFDTDVGDDMRLFLDALIQVDDSGFTHGFPDSLKEDDLKRNYFKFKEAFLDIYFDDYDLRLGKQIITWGKADTSNPTNNINPSEYSNLLDDDDIGVFAVNLTYYFGDSSLQLVGVPQFTPTRLPPEESRFSFLPPGGVVIIEDPRLPFPIEVPVEDSELPSNHIENSQFGLRLTTTHEGWDFSASYYDGVNNLPSPTLRFASGPIPIPEAVVPIYNRFRVVGGDFATTFDRWGFHGEAAQLIYDGDAEDGRFQYVIGVDYTHSNIIFDHDIFVIVEYVGDHINMESDDLAMTSPLGTALTGAFAANITYDLSEYTKVELRGIVDVDGGDDYYFQPQLVHEVTDSFEVTAGLDIVGGPSGTFFGDFRDNDRVFMKLKYSF